MPICCLLIFSKLSFSKKSLSEYQMVVDQEQAQHFVRPDLDTNCLQRFTVDNKKASYPCEK